MNPEDVDNEYSPDIWIKKLKECKNLPVDEVRKLYDEALHQFPSSVKYWKEYLEFEFDKHNFEKALEVFERSIKAIHHVDIWDMYIKISLKLNESSEPDGKPITDVRNSLVQSYERALKHIGLDFNSSDIWLNYIEEVSSWKMESPTDESERISLLRRIFQRAVCIPLSNIEHLWKKYDQFESNLDKSMAKKMIAERSGLYMNARIKSKDLKAFLAEIVPQHFPQPASWTVPQNWDKDLHLRSDSLNASILEDRKKVEAVKRWVSWEQSNPLGFSDQQSVDLRVSYAYKYCLMYLRYFPEVWRDYIEFISGSTEVTDDTLESIMNEALDANPDSLLLTFFIAQLYEVKKKNEEAKEVFERLINSLQNRIVDKLQPATEELNVKVQRLLAISSNSETKLSNNSVSLTVDLKNDDPEHESLENMQERLSKYEGQLKVLTEKANQAWIQYMRFVRRTDGIKGARLIFSRGRKTSYCSANLFISSALMEYYGNKEREVASKIFEVGLKSFNSDIDYITAYVNHLLSINEDGNARALFERSLTVIKDKNLMLNLWKTFLNYEINYGDLKAIKDLEKRFQEAFPNERLDSAYYAKTRYAFMDEEILSKTELGLGMENVHQNGKFTFNAKEIPLRGQKRSISDLAEVGMGSRSSSRTELTESHEEYTIPDIVRLPTNRDEEKHFNAVANPFTSFAVNPTFVKVKVIRPDLGWFNSFQPEKRPPEGKRREKVAGAEENMRQKRPDSPSMSVNYQQSLSDFLSILPAPSIFGGPFINADMFLELLMNTNLSEQNQESKKFQSDRDRRGPSKRRRR